jgi:hypothetical protein
MISGASGSRFFIATTTAVPADLAAYQALVWTEVGEVEDLGEFGDESESITFTSLADARTRKLKGPRDAGTMNVVVGDDMLDTGQIAMEAAEASPIDFNFKVELNDAITVAGDPSEHYFRGKVMSKRRNVGNASNVIRRTFTVGVNSEILSTDPS